MGVTPQPRPEIAGAVTDFAIGEVDAKRLADPSSLSAEAVRVIVVAGIPYGAVVVGFGS